MRSDSERKRPSRLFQRENRGQQLADAKSLRTNKPYDFCPDQGLVRSAKKLALVHLLIEAPYRLISAYEQF